MLASLAGRRRCPNEQSHAHAAERALALWVCHVTHHRPRHVPEVVLEVDRVVAFEVLNRLHAEQNCFYAGTDDSLVREVLHGYVHWHIPAGTLSQVSTKA